MAQRYQMTISLPQDLRSEMAEVNENWSSIAQDAFRRRLMAIEYEKKARTGMHSVIARLKASKEKAENASFQSGREVGLAWAKGEEGTPWERFNAEWPDFVAIAKVFEQQPPDSIHDEHFQTTLENALFRRDEEESDREEFWEGIAGEDWRRGIDSNYLRGFVNGVLDIYEEVKDKV